jgi:hypothetical protein
MEAQAISTVPRRLPQADFGLVLPRPIATELPDSAFFIPYPLPSTVFHVR